MTTDTTERTFEDGLQDGTALAENLSDTQLREELDAMWELLNHRYIEGKIHALSMELGRRYERESR